MDVILRNIIKENGTTNLLVIDDEWQSVWYVPIDYVVFRCITVDIIGSQHPWLRVKDTDAFTIELMKHLFPNYNIERHNVNKFLEKLFQSMVSGERNAIISPNV